MKHVISFSAAIIFLFSVGLAWSQGVGPGSLMNTSRSLLEVSYGSNTPSEAISYDTREILKLGHVIHDPLSLWNDTTYEFTPATDGLFLINIIAGWSPTTLAVGEDYHIGLCINDSFELGRTTVYPGSGLAGNVRSVGVSSAVVVSLENDDSLSVCATHGHVGGTPKFSGVWLKIVRLP